MYLVLMCGLAVFSAWALWHRNPLFSLRRTLRFVVVLGAMFGTFVAAELAAIRFTEHLAQPVQLGVIFGVVGVGTIVMLGVAVSVSLPKASPLPATAKQVHVFRRRTHVWARRLALWTFVFAVLELVLRGPPQIMLGTIGGLATFIGLVMLFGAYLTARRTDQWLSAVEASPWVHWTYSAEQWRSWTDIEVQRMTPRPVKTLRSARDWLKVLPLATPVLGVPLFAIDASWPIRLVFVAVVGAVVVAGMALATQGDRRAPQALRRKLAKADPEVFFGQDGLFADGDFTPWLSAGVYLREASVDQREPRSVTLKFVKIAPGAGAMHEMAMEVSLPLPAQEDVAADLARLQCELRAKCARATVSLA